MAKKAITIYLKSAIESGFDFIKRRFENLDELNGNFHAQRDWIFEKMERKIDYKRRLAKVLEILKMHSCKYIGISFMTENNLCKAYEAQFGEPISKRTASTYIKQLKEIGFVTTMAAKREDGKQTANIVVIEKLQATGESKPVASLQKNEGQTGSENVAHKEAENLHTEKTNPPSKTTLKENKERMAKADRLLNFVPGWFKERISCCSRDAKEVHEFWKVAKHLMKRTFGPLVGADGVQDVVCAAIREFYLSAKAAARGKFRMANPFGFFYTVLEAEGYAHLRRRGQEDSNVLYNWIKS